MKIVQKITGKILIVGLLFASSFACGMQRGKPATLEPNLMLAIASGQEKIVQKFLKNCLIAAKTEDNRSVLHCGACCKNIRIFEMLLKAANKNKELLNARDNSGDAPLHVAAQSKNIAVVRCLLKEKVAINCVNNNGLIPMYIAALNDSEEIVKLLHDANNHDQRFIRYCYDIACSNKDACAKAIFYRILLDDVAEKESSGIQSNTLDEALILGDALKLEELTKGQSFDRIAGCTVAPLYIASAAGHEHLVRLLLLRGAHVNAVSASQETALFAACHKGYSQIVRMLCEAGADVNKCNHVGATPLIVAAQNGHYEIVNCLLQAKAKINEKVKYDRGFGDQNHTALYQASQNGHFSIVKLLVDAGADLYLSYEFNPLFIAIHMGHLEIVRILLEAAKQHNQLSLIEWDLLLQKAKDQEFKKLLESYCQKGSKDMFDSVAQSARETNGSRSCLESDFKSSSENQNLQGMFIMLLKKDERSARELLDKYPTIATSIGFKDITILHVLAESGSLDLITYVLTMNEAKKLLNHVNWCGDTALHRASSNGHIKVVKELLKHGASINIQNNSGDTPLTLATKRNHKDIVALFNLNQLLFKAVDQGDLPKVHQLIQAGAAIDATTQDGKTSLWIAASNGCCRIVDALLAAGANRDIATPDGYKPLFIAAHFGHRDIVEKLL